MVITVAAQMCIKNIWKTTVSYNNFKKVFLNKLTYCFPVSISRSASSFVPSCKSTNKSFISEQVLCNKRVLQTYKLHVFSLTVITYCTLLITHTPALLFQNLQDNYHYVKTFFSKTYFDIEIWELPVVTSNFIHILFKYYWRDGIFFNYF